MIIRLIFQSDAVRGRFQTCKASNENPISVLIMARVFLYFIRLRVKFSNNKINLHVVLRNFHRMKPFSKYMNLTPLCELCR